MALQTTRDVVFTDQSLLMPGDHPQLIELFDNLEDDEDLCFKMKWYVARYAREKFDPTKSKSTQNWHSKILSSQSHIYDSDGNLATLKKKPFRRLDFEVERVSRQFRRDQEGFEQVRILQILQKAYEQYKWDAVINDRNVNKILRQAGQDLQLFVNAERMDDTQKSRLFQEHHTLQSKTNGGGNLEENKEADLEEEDEDQEMDREIVHSYDTAPRQRHPMMGQSQWYQSLPGTMPMLGFAHNQYETPQHGLGTYPTTAQFPVPPCMMWLGETLAPHMYSEDETRRHQSLPQLPHHQHSPPNLGGPHRVKQQAKLPVSTRQHGTLDAGRDDKEQSRVTKRVKLEEQNFVLGSWVSSGQA